ncbi:MAG: PD-(D/E)XK nuclease family transposase [Spirochaetales bacterium]|nr:PD-(D/E)XK nuclease family transposase [Spirochaetales bacterium]
MKQLFRQLSRPVICINILDFNLFRQADKAHLCFIVKEKENNIEYNDHFSIHYIELPKVTKDSKYGKLYMWLRYLAREMYRHDEGTRIAHDTRKIAHAFKKKGIDTAVIAESTGLSAEEISRLDPEDDCDDL